MSADNSKLVTVFGGSGFLGRHVVQLLAKRGYRVRVACRRPDLAGHLQPLGNVGQIHAVQANLRYRWSVDRAVEGADCVVNLVAILFETGKQKFDAIQDFGARAVAEAARAEGANLVHVSAIGADEASASEYARTKARGEKAVFETLPQSIVMRPSILFGPEDGFFNKFAELARFLPFLPLIGGGETKFQPAYVGDVAEAIARAVDGDLGGGKIYELGGPQVLSFRQCIEKLLDITDRKRWLINLPFGMARFKARFWELLPRPLLTVDQVTLLESDNVVSDSAEADGRTFSGIGIVPKTADSVLPSYLWRYRPAGQFSASKPA